MTDEELLNLYTKGGGSSRDVTPDSKTLSDQDIINLYTKGSGPNKDVVTTDDIMGPAKDEIGAAKKVLKGAIRGGLDVGDTLVETGLKAASAAAPILYKSDTADKIRKYKEETIAENKAERDKFNEENPPFSAGDVGRIGGQLAVTLPMFPARAVNAIRAGWRALPTTLPSGVEIAAPLVNRLGATMGIGAAGGAEFGALTSSASNESVSEGALKGAVTGAIAAPLVAGAAKIGEFGARVAKNVWTNAQIDNLVQTTGINRKGAKNVIDRLEEAGYTPQTAAAEVQRLGPNATLMDLDPSLSMEAGGLAQLGGKTTAILKNVAADRAATAGAEAKNIVNTKLGTKPNIDAERQSIVNDARAQTSADYQTAHASPQQLDVAPIASDIDKALETSVGKKTAALAEVKGYLYKNNPDGSKTLKNDVSSLHEVRQGLDDLLDRLPIEGSSQLSNTYRAVSKIRDAVDAQLKTVPEMAAADTKFAEKMKVKDALDYGNEFDKVKRFEEFEKEFTNATLEAQDAMRKGMLTKIHDAMDLASNGQYDAARRLFAKKEINRKMLKLAFGQDADEALDEVAKEIAFRKTESDVLTGSRTAANQAVRQRYGEVAGAGGALKDIVKAAALDVTTGSPALATGINAVRQIGHSGMQRLLSIGHENMAVSTADLLSRQGVMRDNALQILGAVNRIQGRTTSLKPTLDLPRLPIASVPVLNEAYRKLNEQ